MLSAKAKDDIYIRARIEKYGNMYISGVRFRNYQLTNPNPKQYSQSTRMLKIVSNAIICPPLSRISIGLGQSWDSLVITVSARCQTLHFQQLQG